MKITLKGCDHKALEPWGDMTNPDEVGVTCLSCYARLRFTGVKTMNIDLVPDLPAPICDHEIKKPVAAKVTQHMPYRDAICTQCGVILRHPDGRGVWTPVLFYGYLISEEP